MSQVTKDMIEAGCEVQHRYRNEANEREVRMILEAALAGPSAQLFPSKEEIRRLAELALEEMQDASTTDRGAWIASYEKVIMSYRRLALAKQQLADSIPSPHITISAETVLAIRDALIGDDVAEAYHQLYKAVDPSFVKFKPWAEVEAAAATEGSTDE